MYCKNCGEQIDDQAIVCPKCGVAQQPTPSNNSYAQPGNIPPISQQQPGAQPYNMYTPNNGYTQPNPNMYPPNNGYTQPNNMYPPNYMYPSQMPPTVYDSGSFGWGVLGFFIPLVGLILFLVWKSSKPLCAKKAGWGALIRVIVTVVLYIISIVISVASYGYYY